jgi:hypothetical protein
VRGTVNVDSRSGLTPFLAGKSIGLLAKSADLSRPHRVRPEVALRTTPSDVANRDNHTVPLTGNGVLDLRQSRTF